MKKIKIYILSIITLLFSAPVVAANHDIVIHTKDGDTKIKLSHLIKNSNIKNPLNSFQGLIKLNSSKRVFGNYLRDEIQNTSAKDYRVFGQIGNFCTGTLIGPRHVLTAAHCVYSHREKNWNKRIHFTPGRKVDLAPYGISNWKQVFVMDAYIKDNNRDYDFALIVLEKDLGQQLGWINFKYNANLKGINKTKLNIVGYPGDKPLGTMWQVNCPLMTIDSINGVNYTCDTYGGMSGSSLITDSSNGERYIFGIHTFGSPETNGGIYITEEINTILRSWVNQKSPSGTNTASNSAPLPDMNFHKIVYKNNCDQTIWAAIRVLNTDAEWVIKGWWKLLPGAKTLAAKTKQKSFYLYAETDDLSKKWDGSDFNSPIRDTGDYAFKKINFKQDSWKTYTHIFNCK